MRALDGLSPADPGSAPAARSQVRLRATLAIQIAFRARKARRTREAERAEAALSNEC